MGIKIGIKYGVSNHKISTEKCRKMFKGVFQMLFSLARLFILSSHKQVLTGKHCVNFDCSCKYEAGLGWAGHGMQCTIRQQQGNMTNIT